MRVRTSGYHDVETRNDDRRFFEFDSSIVREFYDIEEAKVVRSEWELLITRSGGGRIRSLHCDMVQALY